MFQAPFRYRRDISARALRQRLKPVDLLKGADSTLFAPKAFGCGSKSISRAYAGFGPWYRFEPKMSHNLSGFPVAMFRGPKKITALMPRTCQKITRTCPDLAHVQRIASTHVDCCLGYEQTTEASEPHASSQVLLLPKALIMSL